MSESRGSQAAPANILAIDVGSSRVKLGHFVANENCSSDKPSNALPIAVPRLPEPIASLTLEHDREFSGRVLEELESWIEENFQDAPSCFIASVQPTVTSKLIQVFKKNGWTVPRQLTWNDLPLEVRVEEPSRVGIDRLLNAVAANRLRDPELPAIVVDLGTAGTIELISVDGAFEGGAILPGMSLAARALHSGTSSLPEFDVSALNDSIPVVGKSTNEAIAAGLYWGLVGAVCELIERISSEYQPAPQLFVTGGAAGHVVGHLSATGVPARHVPHMVLSAIRLVGEQLR